VAVPGTSMQSCVLFVRFEVFTALLTKIQVLWDMMLGQTSSSQHFLKDQSDLILSYAVKSLKAL
jgi:hypothetical protein